MSEIVFIIALSCYCALAKEAFELSIKRSKKNWDSNQYGSLRSHRGEFVAQAVLNAVVGPFYIAYVQIITRPKGVKYIDRLMK